MPHDHGDETRRQAATAGASEDSPGVVGGAEREVRELHRFFEEWLSGRAPNTDSAFDRVRDALEPQFRIVTPDGRATGRAELLEGLRSAHGARGAEFRLWTRDVSARRLSDSLVLATYEEWQRTDGRARGRLSTAVMRAAGSSAEGGMADLGADFETDVGTGRARWIAVHETWLP